MSTIQRFNFDVDLLKVVPWQKDQAPNLISLLNKKSDWYLQNHTEFWSNWERDIFNLYTANDFGLNVWSIILNLPLYTDPNESPPDYPAFGFAGFGLPFDQGNFATSGSLANKLTTEQRRTLLLLRWVNITTDGTVAHINENLSRIFLGGAYCLDGLDMTMTYIFASNPSDIMMDLMRTYDLLPRPAGVKISVIIQPRAAFGFAPFGVAFDQEFSQFGRIL